MRPPHMGTYACRKISRLRPRLVSPSGLSPGRERLETLADLHGGRRIQLIYVDILKWHHEAQPVFRIPAERESSDLLLAAIDPAGEPLRHARNDIAVEVNCAVTGCDFPNA